MTIAAPESEQQDPIALVAWQSLRALERILGPIGAILLAVLLCLVLGSVMLRYGFGTGLIGADELAIWLHVALVGLGAPLALGGSLDLRLDALVNRLPGGLRGMAKVLAQSFVLLGGIVLADGGGEAIGLLGGVSPSLGLPEWVRFTAPCLGGVLIVTMTALRDVAEGRSAGLAVAAAIAICAYVCVPMLGPSTAMPASLAATLAMLAGLAAGAPLPHTLLAAAYLSVPFGSPLTEAAIVSTAVAGVSKFLLLAIPFFLLAGNLFSISGLVERLVRLARTMVGHWQGGMAQTALLTSLLFSGASGSSIANAAFGAKTFAPALAREGYPPARAGAVIAATSVLDNVIPPSIAFLILASATELSVGKLLVGGVWAGLLMAAALAASIRWTAPNLPRALPATAPDRLAAAKASFPALGLGAIVLAGIRFGVVTPTEAAAVAAMYTLLACIPGDWCCRRVLTSSPSRDVGESGGGRVASADYGNPSLKTSWQDVRTAFRDAAIASAGIGLMIGSAAPFAFLLAVDDIGGKVTAIAAAFGHSPVAVLLFANLVLLIAGMLIDIGAAILLLAPILLPLGVAAGIDPTHFGVILVVNLMIGGLTPPVGILVYVVAGAMKLPAAAVFSAVLPHVVALLGALAAISTVAWFAVAS
jgi:TRAP-type C4-dicarboxylate transport system permease large subunit/TRAP-type C4-dicarboxylate transport system permease small subunit